ncbi:transposase [Chengkuizengella sp. SCS-71B]|uniref:transposase n=1 Tax=Chengkuizengella sp. SCS-71B TaxID=3115290 RepID=UPI0032C218EB
MQNKAETIEKSIRGNLTKPQADKMRVCLDHFDSIEKHIADIESVVLELAQPYLRQIEIILSLPSIKDVFTAIAIIGEIGTDMSMFHSSKHLCSWAGLTPQNNESAGKKKSVRISRAGVYIKPLLVQCANAAIKSKKCTYFKVRYDQIKKRRGHKKAIIAIAGMLLNCIYFTICLIRMRHLTMIYKKSTPSQNETMHLRSLRKWLYVTWKRWAIKYPICTLKFDSF